MQNQQNFYGSYEIWKPCIINSIFSKKTTTTSYWSEEKKKANIFVENILWCGDYLSLWLHGSPAEYNQITCLLSRYKLLMAKSFTSDVGLLGSSRFCGSTASCKDYFKKCPP